MANLDRVLPFPPLPTFLPPPPPLDDDAYEQLLDEREESVELEGGIEVEVGGATELQLATGARRSGMELRFSRVVGVVAGRGTPPTTREA